MADRVQWGAGREQAFLDWIDQEMRQALSARVSLERNWRRWLEQYRAPANRPLKEFPFYGAANFELPLTAIDVDQLYAKFIQTIHAPTNLWTLEPLNPQWEDATKPLQDFLQWLDRALIKMEGINKRALLELVKLGTCIYKTGWLFEHRLVTIYDSQGNRQRIPRTVSRPIVDHVRLADFLIPPYGYDIDPDAQGGMPWVAERFRRPIDHLESIADASEPYLPNYGRLAMQQLRNHLTRTPTEYDEKVQDLDYNKTARTKNAPDFDTSNSTETDPNRGGTLALTQDVEWWQIHARFATTAANGSQDDIVVEYHPETRMILRATYQPFNHGKRPYSVARYFPGEGFYGIGVCEQNEMFQRAESDMFNYTHDNVLLSNAVGIAAKAGANIGPGEPVYPGKIWVTDGNPREELMAFNLGQPYGGLTQIQGQMDELRKVRTGIGDLQSGNIQGLPSRTPATSVQALLEEGARRPDLTLNDIRDCLGEVGRRVVQLLQQYMSQPAQGAGGEVYAGLIAKVLGPESATKVLAKLMLSPDSVDLGFGVTLTATSATANKELAKQNIMALIQLQTQISEPIMGLMTQAMQAQGTPLGQAALDLVQGMVYLQKRAFEQSDIRNVNELVPQVPQDPLPGQGGGGPPVPMFPGGGPAPPGAPGQPPLEALSGAPGAGGPAGI